MSTLSDLLNSQPVTARQAADIAAERNIRLPYGTIAAYWSGRHGRPSAQTLERLAEVLPFSIDQLQRAAWGRTAPVAQWTPPPEVRLLDERQRLALDELIRSIAATARGVLDEDQGTQDTTDLEAPRGGVGSPTTTTGAGNPRDNVTPLNRRNPARRLDKPRAASKRDIEDKDFDPNK